VQPTPRALLEQRLATVPSALAGVAAPARRLVRIAPSSDPLTDDRAPVEWLTDQMIVDYAASGAGG
jgi:hypothetical protein